MVALRILYALLVVALPVAVMTTGTPAASKTKDPATPARSSGAAERIAAVVNEEIITLSDLNARMRLALLSSNLPDNAEARQRLQTQVLRSLVDEALQLQEASRLNITVTDDDVSKGLARIAEQNRMGKGDLERLLASRNVPMSTLRSQVKSSVAWGKVIQKRLRPTVQIGEDEIDAALERIKANIGKPEYLVAEIFLAVDTPAQEEPVRRAAERLLEQLRNGAPFAPVARQFSQSPGAANGGDLGWVQQGQLPEELDKAVRETRPGQVSRPVRGASGYHILMVRSQRTVGGGGVPSEDSGADVAGAAPDITVHAKQGLLPPGATQAKIEEVQRLIKGCKGVEARMREVGGDAGDAGRVKLNALQPAIARMLATQPIGVFGPPTKGKQGEIRMIMVCERSEAPPKPAKPTPPPAPAPTKTDNKGLPPREEIMAMLGSDRLEMLARRYLRDLRRAAFIETRL